MKVTVRRFLTNPFSVSAIRNAALSAVGEYAIDVQAEYDDTIETFSGDLNTSAIARKAGESATVNIYVRGDSMDVENYMRLDRGFLRRVPIVPGYEPKTSPGVVGSRSGGGIVGRGVLKQPVWVEARRFTETIAANIRDGAMARGTLGQHVAKRLRRRVRVGGYERLI